MFWSEKRCGARGLVGLDRKKKSRKKEVKKGGFEPASLKVSLMRLGYAQRERGKMPLLSLALS